MKKFIQSLVVVASIMIGSSVLAEPTVKEIYQTSQTDRAAALNMINAVIKNRPNSARAHFIKAELLLSMNKKAEAKESFFVAEKLDPTFAYARPETVTKLRTALGVKSKPDLFDNTSMFIVGGIIVGGVIIIWLIVRRRETEYPRYLPSGGLNKPITPYNQVPPLSENNSVPPSATGVAGATGTAAAPSRGSGIMGGLATGAAMGAGAVAGAALVNHMMNGNKASAAPAEPTAAAPEPAPSYVPDSDFGFSDSGSDWGGDSGGDGGDNEW